MANVLPDLSQVIAQQNEVIAKLQAQVEAMRNAPAQRVTFKISEKGAISVCGLQRFPVTLYASQWERVAQEMPRIMAFIKEHASQVARKPE